MTMTLMTLAEVLGRIAPADPDSLCRAGDGYSARWVTPPPVADVVAIAQTPGVSLVEQAVEGPLHVVRFLVSENKVPC